MLGVVVHTFNPTLGRLRYTGLPPVWDQTQDQVHDKKILSLNYTPVTLKALFKQDDSKSRYK